MNDIGIVTVLGFIKVTELNHCDIATVTLIIETANQVTNVREVSTAQRHCTKR